MKLSFYLIYFSIVPSVFGQVETFSMRDDFYSSNKKAQTRGEIAHFAIHVSERVIKNTLSENVSEQIAIRSLLFSKKESTFANSVTFRGFNALNNLISIDGIVFSNDFGHPYSNNFTGNFDANVLHKIEVLYGNQSITYGKDALGSVTTLFSPDVDFFRIVKSRQESSIKASFISSLMGGSILWGYKFQSKNFFTYSSISLHDYSMYQTGSASLGGNPKIGLEPYEAIYNASLQKDIISNRPDPYSTSGATLIYGQFVQKFGLKHKENQLEACFFISKNPEIGFSKIDQKIPTSSIYAQGQISNPTSFISNIIYKFNKDQSLWTKATAALSGSEYGSCESSRMIDSVNWSSIDYQVKKIQLQWDAYKNYDARRVFFYGLLSNFSWIQMKSIQSDPAQYTPTESPFTSHHFIYLKEEYRVSDNVSLHWGGNLGWDHMELQLKNRLDPNPVFMSKNELSSSFNFSWTRHSCENSNYTISFTYNRRSPNANEYFPIIMGTSFVPNITLSPQQSISIEGAIYKKIDDQLEFHICPYLYLFKDKIIFSSSLYNNHTFYQTKNINNSFVVGTDFVTKYHLNKKSMLYGQVSYCYGQDIDTRLPLASINPVYGKIGYKHKFNNVYVDLSGNYQGAKQPWLYSSSIEENASYGSYKDNEFIGSPFYFTINLRATINLVNNAQLHASINNILDENYRGYASMINGLGRTLCLSFYKQF